MNKDHQADNPLSNWCALTVGVVADARTTHWRALVTWLVRHPNGAFTYLLEEDRQPIGIWGASKARTSNLVLGTSLAVASILAMMTLSLSSNFVPSCNHSREKPWHNCSVCDLTLDFFHTATSDKTCQIAINAYILLLCRSDPQSRF